MLRSQAMRPPVKYTHIIKCTLSSKSVSGGGGTSQWQLDRLGLFSQQVMRSSHSMLEQTQVPWALFSFPLMVQSSSPCDVALFFFLSVSCSLGSHRPLISSSCSWDATTTPSPRSYWQTKSLLISYLVFMNSCLSKNKGREKVASFS